MNAPLIQPVEAIGPAQQLANACEATLLTDAYGPQVLPSPTFTPTALVSGWVAPIADLGLLRVEGEDAIRFLHAQLTNDLEGLADGTLQLTGYCSAKGRLLATFLCWRDGDAVLLLASQPLLAGLRKRLSMFVLRAKARILDASDSWCCFGVGGVGAHAAIARLDCAWPSPMLVSRAVNVTALGMPAVDIANGAETDATQSHSTACAMPAVSGPSASATQIDRALVLCPATEAARVWRTLSSGLHPAPSRVWRLTEILAGTPRIVAAGVEHFVPQMVNLDRVEGVSFRKGCYPGQEIVARSHYLGKLKRRMFLAWVDGDEPAPGTDVFGSEGAEPIGELVMAAPTPSGRICLLFESQIAAAQSARLADGRALTILPLPYPVGG